MGSTAWHRWFGIEFRVPCLYHFLKFFEIQISIFLRVVKGFQSIGRLVVAIDLSYKSSMNRNSTKINYMDFYRIEDS